MDCLSKPKLTNKADVYTWTGDAMDGYSFPKTFCTFKPPDITIVAGLQLCWVA